MKTDSKLRILFNAVLLFAALSFVGCNGTDTVNSNAPAPVISGPPRTGLPMPSLNGKSLETVGWDLGNGGHNAFGDFKGKVLVLDFYATWCDPCRRSVPHLIDLQRRYEDDLRIVGLNVGGPGDAERVPEFAREMKIQYSLGVPDDELVSLLLADSDAIPQTFVFDRKGKLSKRFVGFGETTGEEIDRAVETALRSSD